MVRYGLVDASTGLKRIGKRERAELVYYLRSDPGNRPAEPESLLDEILLNLFPGRTLEELDEIDLNRLYRAKSAARMQAVEVRRKRFLAGKLKGSDLDADDWQLIVQMDELAKGD
jgi:hypothetical protein